ncbi:MAG: HAD-IA family hydrolase [Bryobacteraceae bacterium]
MLPIELVIFDCDGVLVDSESLGCETLIALAAEHGVEIGLEEALLLFQGRKMSVCVEEIERRRGAPLPDSFVPTVRTRMAAAFRRDLRPIEGVSSVLESLAIPYCVASSGPREKIQLSLELTGMLRFFENRIFSAYEVGSWKPDPGLFLHAANAMGTTPAACAVIEDSRPGVEAGIAAGMKVFAYTPAGDPLHLSQKGAIAFHSMEDLPAYLRGSLEGGTKPFSRI